MNFNTVLSTHHRPLHAILQSLLRQSGRDATSHHHRCTPPPPRCLQAQPPPRLPPPPPPLRRHPPLPPVAPRPAWGLQRRRG
ncbi:unnamed protein product [Closterium sp. NIES-53]